MVIGAYYIDRSYTHTPCWDIAISRKEAFAKAKKWAMESNCYVSVSTAEKQIALFDEKGNRITA